MPQSVQCNGNILPNTWVKFDSSTPSPFAVIQSTTLSGEIYAISQDGSFYPPGLLNNPATLYAGIAGYPIQIYVANDICLLVTGSAGWSEGDLIQSDATGAGITFTPGSTAGWYGAIGMTVQASGDLGRVRVIGPTYAPA